MAAETDWRAARGTAHAGTDRFRKILEARRFQPNQLLLSVPDLGHDTHTALVHEGLHVRIERMDGLYLVHLRQPLPFDILSAREQQIARALGAGKTFKSVAKQCEISISTVANHATASTASWASSAARNWWNSFAPPLPHRPLPPLPSRGG